MRRAFQHFKRGADDLVLALVGEYRISACLSCKFRDEIDFSLLTK
jgi:hypothetical protein